MVSPTVSISTVTGDRADLGDGRIEDTDRGDGGVHEKRCERAPEGRMNTPPAERDAVCHDDFSLGRGSHGRHGPAGQHGAWAHPTGRRHRRWMANLRTPRV